MKILAALEVWGVLGVGQLHGLAAEDAPAAERTDLFFNEMDRRLYWTRLFKRLVRLESQGCIRGHVFVNHRKAYTLAARGHELLHRGGLARLAGYRDSIEESLLDHELTAAAAGLVMTELLGLDVRSERERFQWTGRGGRARAPERGGSDLWIVDRRRPKAVEIEMGQKSEGRYEDIFEGYRRRMPPGGAVLYLTAWPTGVGCILRHARRHRASFVYACSLADFRRTAGRAPFVCAADEEPAIHLGRGVPILSEAVPAR
ncbi:MAG: hypothetical protein KGM24_05135 [Elusimicrobia bacterium]|nr:hypothetical protein [Elusimicrobiota bacterium]